jgi:hypothetical protein
MKPKIYYKDSKGTKTYTFFYKEESEIIKKIKRVLGIKLNKEIFTEVYNKWKEYEKKEGFEKTFKKIKEEGEEID